MTPGTAVIAGAAGMCLVGGALLIVVGLQRSPEPPPRPRSTPVWRRWWDSRRNGGTLLVVGILGGLVGLLLTGWPIALVAVPAACLGIPTLLAPPTRATVERLDAMAEWTRSLSGVLAAGVGLEQAIAAAGRSTPTSIKPEADRLIARLRARWSTEDALRAFADELNDPTGDLIAAALILGARRRGAGLAAVLDGLAESVSNEVNVRRQIEIERDRPRTTARWVTLISVVVLALLATNGTYLAPYSTPVGQLVLAVLLTAYAGCLVWLRKVVIGKPPSRFLTVRAAREVPQ